MTEWRSTTENSITKWFFHSIFWRILDFFLIFWIPSSVINLCTLIMRTIFCCIPSFSTIVTTNVMSEIAISCAHTTASLNTTVYSFHTLLSLQIYFPRFHSMKQNKIKKQHDNHNIFGLVKTLMLEICSTDSRFTVSPSTQNA